MIKKTLLTALLTAPLLGASLHSAYAATEFNDISNSYAKDAINKLVEAGILNGNGSGQFNPTGKISRQDFAIILVKGLGLDIESPAATPTFSDVPTSHYAYKYVEAAVKAGLLKGTGGGQFGLGQNLSRQDMAVIFARALGANTQGYGQSLTFSDAGQIADYAKDAVGFAVANGLLTGTGGGKFDPTSIADRQSVALVASRFIQTVKPQTPAQPVPQPTTPTPTTPAVPVPAPVVNVPSTPSIPAPSGNTGGSIETPVRDVQAPVLTLISVAPFKIGTDLTVRSNEAGTVYLVPTSPNVPSKSVLDGLVTAGQGVKATATTAGGDVLLPTSTLTAGLYNAYAVDASGNVSIPVTEIMLKAVLKGPEFEVSSPSMIGATFPEELNPLSQPSEADFAITRIDDASNHKVDLHQVNVIDKGVNFLLSDSLVKGGIYQVVYAPKENSQPIKGISGKVFGPFTSTFTYTNIAPEVDQLLKDLTLATNSTFSAVDVLSAFHDWDFDDQELLYSVKSSNTDVVDASMEGSKLYLHTKGALSSATITLTAEDSSGEKASQTFTVTVVDAETAITAAESAVAESKNLTSILPSDRSSAEQTLTDARKIVETLTDGTLKNEYISRLTVVENTLEAVKDAETLVKALEDATVDGKNLLTSTPDNPTDRDDADMADSNIVYDDLVKGTSRNLLETRAAKARLFMNNADLLENNLTTAEDYSGYDLSKGLDKRTIIDEILETLSYENATAATVAVVKPRFETIQKLIADTKKAEDLVVQLETEAFNNQDATRINQEINQNNYAGVNTATRTALEARVNEANKNFTLD